MLRCLLINSTPQDAERKRRRDAELAKLPETISSAYTKFGKTEIKAEQKQERLHWHGDEDRAPLRAWLAKGLLPETGVGLISGQWGTFKTFVGLDLAAAVMAGLAFIDYPIARNGGVSVHCRRRRERNCRPACRQCSRPSIPTAPASCRSPGSTIARGCSDPTPSMPLPISPARRPSACKRISASRWC